MEGAFEIAYQTRPNLLERFIACLSGNLTHCPCLMQGRKNWGVWGVTPPPNRKNSAVCRAIEFLCRAIIIPKNCAIYLFQCLLWRGLTFLRRTGVGICFYTRFYQGLSLITEKHCVRVAQSFLRCVSNTQHMLQSCTLATASIRGKSG